MTEFLTNISESVEVYGLFVIFPFLFIENIPFIGFIAPGVTVLFFTGFFYELLPLALVPLFLLCVGTICLADTVWYTLGRTCGTHSHFIARIAEKSPNVEELLTTQSPAVLLFYQFPPYLRMFLPFAFGMYRYPVLGWVLLALSASLIYTTVFFGGGVLAARSFSTISGATAMSAALNGALVVGIVLYTLYLTIRYIKIRNQEHSAF